MDFFAKSSLLDSKSLVWIKNSSRPHHPGAGGRGHPGAHVQRAGPAHRRGGAGARGQIGRAHV